MDCQADNKSCDMCFVWMQVKSFNFCPNCGSERHFTLLNDTCKDCDFKGSSFLGCGECRNRGYSWKQTHCKIQ